MQRRYFLAVSIAAMAAVSGAPAMAQTAYPNKTAKIIAPVQPGGGVDLVARTIAEQLTKSLKSPFVVENISGGGGIVGSMGAKRAAPDGYTLFL